MTTESRLTADGRATDDRPWWKATWPLDRWQYAALGWSLLVVVAVGTAIGWLYTDLLAPNAITDWDERIARDIVDARTETGNDLAPWGAGLSDTHVKIIATAVIVLGLVACLRRWHEALFVVTTLVFEATAFITITFIVGRARPDVEALVTSPVDSSFPSGHVAAATVYGAFAIVVFWLTRAWWARALAVAGSIAVVAAVATARLYQGVHYATDVMAGVVLGLVSLAICHRIFGPPGRGKNTRPQPTPSTNRKVPQ